MKRKRKVCMAFPQKVLSTFLNFNILVSFFPTHILYQCTQFNLSDIETLTIRLLKVQLYFFNIKVFFNHTVLGKIDKESILSKKPLSAKLDVYLIISSKLMCDEDKT